MNKQGWVDDPRKVEEAMKTLPFPVFGDINTLQDTGKGKRVLLYDIIRKVAKFPYRNQDIGDCLNGSALIKMSDGTEKEIKDIVSGDKVITPYGNIKTVTRTIKKPYNKKMVQIYVKGHVKPLTVTPDHLCMNLPNVKGGNRLDRNEIKWAAAISLNEGDKILLPKMPSISTKKYDLKSIFSNLICESDDFKKLRTPSVPKGYVRNKGSKYNIKRHILLDERLGYLVGIFAAEGSHDNCRITFNLSSKETHIAKKISLYVKDIFGFDVKVCRIPLKPSVLYVRISNKVIAAFFKHLCGGNTYTKQLNPELLLANEQAKMGILDGWMTGDGRKNKIGVSVNQDLIYNMFDIALSLGINPSIVKRKAYKQSKESYGLNINNAVLTSTSIGYKLKLSQKQMVEHGKAASIKKIEIVQPKDNYVYCLEVEDDHCFIADKYGVHNCVSMGTAYAVDAIKAVDIYLKGDFEEWVAETATEDIYAGSRVTIGGGRIRGDGSLGVWAAKYVSEYGALARQKYGNVDLSKYSGSRAKSWGRPGNGPPKTIIDIAKEHPVETVSQVKTWEEVRDLVANGYAVTIASMQGFASRRDSEGFARPQGQWAHQMCAKKDTIIKGQHNKLIQNIKIGDKVYDLNGNLQRVSEIYERPYNGDVVKLKISGRETITLTPNHPILIYRKTSNKIEAFNSVDIPLYANKEYKLSNKNTDYDINKRFTKWVNVEDVKIGDWVFCPKPKLEHSKEPVNWISSKRKAIRIPKPIVMDKAFSWFLGLYAADGNVTPGHKLVITCHKSDTHIIEKCKQFITNNLGLTPSIKPYKNAIRIICYSSIVADSFHQWFGTSSQKNIPNFVLSKCDLESFIQGVVDGDGSIINDYTFKITNCNPCMIETLHTILLNLGYCPTVNKFSYKDKEYGNKNWSDRYEIRWCTIDSKRNNWWSKDNYIYRISDIEIETLDDTVYNLEVENTHTYIANGFVVHNCILAIDDEYRRPGACVQNSWGTQWISGPKRHNQPEGSFWVDADELERRILRTGDCWAYSGYEGFKPKQLNTRII